MRGQQKHELNDQLSLETWTTRYRGSHMDGKSTTSSGFVFGTTAKAPPQFPKLLLHWCSRCHIVGAGDQETYTCTWNRQLKWMQDSGVRDGCSQKALLTVWA